MDTHTQHVPQHVHDINSGAQCVCACCVFTKYSVLSAATDVLRFQTLCWQTLHHPLLHLHPVSPSPHAVSPCTVYCIYLHPSFPLWLPWCLIASVCCLARWWWWWLRGVEGGRDCALSCRESRGVPDWRKMSRDCSLAEMATDKNAQRVSCLETGCTTWKPEEEEEGVTEGKREGVSRLRER